MRKRSTLTLIAALWSLLPCTANSPVTPVVFNGVSLRDPIGLSMCMLEDPAGRMDLNAAMAADHYSCGTAAIPNLGTTRSAYWIRFDLENNSAERTVVAQLMEPDIDEVDVYLSNDRGEIHLSHAGKARLAPPTDRFAADMAFQIPLGPGQRGTIYFRVRSVKQLQVPIVLLTSADVVRDHGIKRGFIGAFIGIMLVMALYNLFVYFSIRDRSYLTYVIYLLFVGATQLSFLGMLPLNQWPGTLWLSGRTSVLLTVLTAIAASEFMKRFIHVKEHLPRISRFTPLFYVLLLSAPLLDLTGFPVTGYNLAQAMAGLFATYLLMEAGIIAYRGSRPAMFFIAAWCLFLTGVIVFILKDVRVLPYNALTKHLMPLGSVLEVVLLSFGLADKINILRREKERSQADALRISLENERIIREQNTMLEQKVDERTHELRESNDHLKRTQTQLVNAEKMASLGQLTAGIAHEINNPVNFISSNIPPLRRNIGEMMDVLKRYRDMGIHLDTPEVQAIRAEEQDLGIDDSIAETADILNSIENGAGRTAEIVRGLRNFSRLDEGDLKIADINEGVRSTLAVLSPHIRDKVKIELDLGALPAVECFPGKLNQVLMNVLTNASQAVKANHPEGGGTVKVTTRTTGDFITITISDNGPGFPEEVKTRMFEPFYTTKGVGEGTGLGLSIAYGIMEKHNGSIEAESRPGEGAEFRLILPIEHTKAAKRA